MSRKVRSNLKFLVGDHVYDKSWPWRSGIVRKVFKKTIHIELMFGVMPGEDHLRKQIYDQSHFQFLRLICNKHPKYEAKRKPRTCKTCWRIYEM